MIYMIRKWGLWTTLRWYLDLWRLKRHTADIKMKVCELTGLTDHEVSISIEKTGAINIYLRPDTPATSISMSVEYSQDELKRWLKETYDLT